MKTCYLAFLFALVLALPAVACGAGDAGGPRPGSFEENQPIIYTEQPGEPLEKPTHPDSAPSNQERPAPASESRGTPSVVAVPSSEGSNTEADCSYDVDLCMGCAEHDDCVECISTEDQYASIAEEYCGTVLSG